MRCLLRYQLLGGTAPHRGSSFAHRQDPHRPGQRLRVQRCSNGAFTIRQLQGQRSQTFQARRRDAPMVKTSVYAQKPNTRLTVVSVSRSSRSGGTSLFCRIA